MGPAGHTFQGEFVEAAATRLQDARPGNYVVFRGLTSDTVEIRVDSARSCLEDDGPSPVVNAIQIIGGRDRSRVEIEGDADKDAVLGDSGVAYLFDGRNVDLRTTQSRGRR